MLKDGLVSTVVKSGYLPETAMILDTLWVVGLPKSPTNVIVNGKKASFYYQCNLQV